MMKINVLFLALLLLSLSCTKNKDEGLKVFHHFSPSKIATFDPIQISDVYSHEQAGKVYEALYEYHPFKRPYELMPNLATAMPKVSEDGLQYEIKIKSGVRFQDDPAFPNGKGRELKIDDLLYSIKRLADPKNRATGWWILDGKIKGLNEWRNKHKDSKSTNYTEVIEGMKKVDDYTVLFTLTQPFPQFIYALAMGQTFIVAEEAVKHYGEEFLNHPVGTGPFLLEKNEPHRLTFVKNPNFREKFFPSEGSEETKKKIPFLDKITVDIIVETQPRWMNFQRANLDFIFVPSDSFQEVVGADGELKPELKKMGVQMSVDPLMDVTYAAFNMENKLFQNKKLREAISLAYDRVEENKLFYNNTGILAQSVIPPSMKGYQDDFKNPLVSYDLEKAKKLLAEAGYPEGKGLPEITLDITNSSTARQQAEHFTMNLKRVGVKIKPNINTWPELSNKAHKSQFMLLSMAWLADYPDAENFLALLYCPNKSPGSNAASYCNPVFDKLYEKAVIMQDSPERTMLYEELNHFVAREVPWIFSLHRTRHHLVHAWVKNFKFTEFSSTQFQYLDVDLNKKKEILTNL
jgi:oligopeptide transport system substrate-binding protein